MAVTSGQRTGAGRAAPGVFIRWRDGGINILRLFRQVSVVPSGTFQPRDPAWRGRSGRLK